MPAVKSSYGILSFTHATPRHEHRVYSSSRLEIMDPGFASGRSLHCLNELYFYTVMVLRKLLKTQFLELVAGLKPYSCSWHDL